MLRTPVRRSVCLAATLLPCLLTGCGSDRQGTPVSPSASSGPRLAATTSEAAPATTSSTGAVPRPAAAILPFDLPGGVVTTIVAFPPRNESYDFRQELERKYRDSLHRTAGSSFVDVEGDVVWTQEYLRYRTNGCDHPQAVARTLAQIAGAAGPPVCGDPPSGIVAFPPRDQSYAFRQELEFVYRDRLGRTASQSFVDLEGAIVWTQEYLRYRVNDCSHASAVARVFLQIDGGSIAPVCRREDPRDPLTGIWHGTSDYPNAPFTMDLILRGQRLSGWYQDRHDRGWVDADYAGGGTIRLHVYFGDTGFFMDGRFDGENRIRGSFRVPVLGSRLFEFDMRR